MPISLHPQRIKRSQRPKTSMRCSGDTALTTGPPISGPQPKGAGRSRHNIHTGPRPYGENACRYPTRRKRSKRPSPTRIHPPAVLNSPTRRKDAKQGNFAPRFRYGGVMSTFEMRRFERFQERQMRPIHGRKVARFLRLETACNPLCQVKGYLCYLSTCSLTGI